MSVHLAEQYTLVDTALSQAMAKIRVNRKAESVQSYLAYGRVSAVDVLAPYDIPRFPTSHWDGYAVMSGDLSRASDSSPVSLRVVGTARPGESPRTSISHGEAFQVATGAPLPARADSVVPAESAQVNGNQIVVRRPSPPGSHVYSVGEDTKKGMAILRKGQTIRVQDLGQLIAMGFRRTRVWRKSKVSVLATGSELTDSRRPKKGKVADTHSPIFLQLCETLGCTAVDVGLAKDDRADISRKVRKALAKSDLVLTLGGTSAGKRDYVTTVVAGLNHSLFIHGIKMDRGRVAGIAVVKGKPIVMMPGPIQGAMNAFLLLAIPFIEILSGTKGKESELYCTLGEPWEARSRYADFRKVVYVKLEPGAETIAKPLLAETESMRILTEAEGYVVVPENVARIDAGGRVAVRLLPGFSFA